MFILTNRDPLKSRTAWMFQIKAKNIPSICVRSAKFWATTAAVCNKPSRWPLPIPIILEDPLAACDQQQHNKSR